MVKKIIKVLPIIFAITCLLIACNVTESKTYTVSFMVDGTLYKNVQTDGKSIQMPNDPTSADYTFEGWFYDDGTFAKPFTAESLSNEPLSSDTTVYAKLAKKEPEVEPPDQNIKYELPSEGVILSGEGEYEDISVLYFTTQLLVDNNCAAEFMPADVGTYFTYFYSLDVYGNILFYRRLDTAYYEEEPSGEGKVDGNKINVTMTYEGKEYVFENEMYQLSISYGTVGSKQNYEPFWTPGGYSVRWAMDTMLNESDSIVFNGKSYTYENLCNTPMPRKNCKIDITPHRVINSAFNGMLTFENGDQDIVTLFTSNVLSDEGYYSMIMLMGDEEFQCAYSFSEFGKMNIGVIIEEDEEAYLSIVGLARINNNVFSMEIRFNTGTIKVQTDIYSLNITAGAYSYVLWGSPDTLISQIMYGVELKVEQSFTFNGTDYDASDFSTLRMPRQDSVIVISSEALDDKISENAFNGTILSTDDKSKLNFSVSAFNSYAYEAIFTAEDGTEVTFLYTISGGKLTLYELKYSSASEQYYSEKLSEGTIDDTNHIIIEFSYKLKKYNFNAVVHKVYIKYGRKNNKTELNGVWIQEGKPMILGLDEIVLESDTITMDGKDYTYEEFKEVKMPNSDCRIDITPDAFTYTGFNGIISGSTSSGDSVAVVFGGSEAAEGTGIYYVDIYVGDESPIQAYYMVQYGRIQILVYDGNDAQLIGYGTVGGIKLTVALFFDENEIIEMDGEMYKLELTYRENKKTTTHKYWVAAGCPMKVIFDIFNVKYGSGAFITLPKEMYTPETMDENKDGIYETEEDFKKVNGMVMPEKDIEIMFEAGTV